MTTIVSAFICNINIRKDRDFNKYYEYGKLILKTNTCKILFLDETMMKLFESETYDVSNTLLVKINKDSLFLNDYEKIITNFDIHTTSKEKDTIQYMFTQCNKSEWVKNAIELDPFHTDMFVWIDFGIKHMNHCSDEIFIEKLNNLNDKKYSKVRISSIWDLDVNYYGDIYKDVKWHFTGSMFGGHKDALITFHEKMKEKCLEIIYSKNTIMWEVNIWYLIYLENKDLFDAYKSTGHNKTVIDNY